MVPRFSLRWLAAAWLLPCCCGIAWPESTPTASPLAAAEQTAFQRAVDQVAASIVRIEPVGLSTARLQTAAEATPATGPSSGLVVDSDGWVLTTAFAVPDDTSEAVIVLPPTATAADAPPAPVRLVGQVTGRDTNRGLVLLKCTPPAPLPVPTWADGATLRPGQWAIAAGRVWDSTRPSVAVGILSAVDRAWGRAVQTDAAVSPVNYGGPLIDIRGQVIGILAPLPADTAGMQLGTELYDSGIGFAVPMADLLPLLPRLKQGEDLRPGLLGIGYATADPVNGPAVITTVRADSPAAKAGLRSGDRIETINDQPVRRIADARHALSPRQAGDAVTLVVRRGPEATPEAITTQATLVGELPPWQRTMLGIVPTRQPPARDQQTVPTAVEIGWVWPESPAAKAGLQAGDSIIAAAISSGTEDDPSLQPIGTAAELAGLLGGLAVDTTVVLERQRGDDRRRVRLQTVLLPSLPPTAVPASTDFTPPALVRLEAPELAEPGWAILPDSAADQPLGVLFFFGEPAGPLPKAAATRELARWREAAGGYQVAVVLLGSTDTTRWGRDDLERVGRSLDALASRRPLDPTRIAFTGRGAGGTFAWLAADRFARFVSGVGLLDAMLPSRVKISPAAPDQFRWVLFGDTGPETSETETATSRRQAADRERLRKAGLTVGSLPPSEGEAADLCRWVECLGVR